MGCERRQELNGFLYVMLLSVSQLCLAADLPDPTRPLDEIVQHSSEGTLEEQLPVLRSVLIGSDRRLAIIDGKRYRENDRIGS